MGRKKKFIDKKKSATFQLFARDSSNPNYDQTLGSDRVFVRVDNNDYSVGSFVPNYDDEEDANSKFADALDDVDDGDDMLCGGFGGGSSKKAAALPENLRKEILELGFPDDGYNYMTHLREIKNNGAGSSFYSNPKTKIEQLPLDVKAYDASRVRVSELRSDEGNDKSTYSIGSKAVGVRVQKVVDPDVAALLDDSDLSRFGSDVEDLEEDFVVRANQGEASDADEEENLIGESDVIDVGKYEFGSSSHQEKAADYVCEGKVGSFPVNVGNVVGDDVRVRRPLDDQFDLLERQEYGSDDEDNDFDDYMAEEDESLANKLKNALNGHAVDELELGDKYAVPADLLHGNEEAESKELAHSAADVIRRCMEYAERYENENEDGDIVIVEESSDESEEWDCDTIVSTYSNLENHPAKIGAPEIARKKLAETVFGAPNTKSQMISLGGKEKLPVDFLPHKKSATEKLKRVPGLKTEHHKRKQHGQESKEEKKERKAAVKEEKREARRVKKETKELYRGEAQRAQRVAAVGGPTSIHLM